MLASVVVNSIRSALDPLDRSPIKSRIGFLKYYLKFLELFVLCARNLGIDAQPRFNHLKDTTLGSLLQRIHDVVGRIQQQIQHDCDESKIRNFRYNIQGLFREELGHWFNTLSDSGSQPTSPLIDEVREIFDSVLENLEGIFQFSTGRSLEPIVAMIERITFMRNFIRFVTLRSVEPRQLDNLLDHIQGVAVEAAHISYIYILEDVVEPNVSVMLQMIQMVDPEVYETYTQALTNFELSTQLHSPIYDKDYDPSLIMKDFIDSLLWNLWERHMESRTVISTNFELQLLYGGLRLLRSMLKEQPNKFDNQIGELTRVVICDAGLILFSLHQKDMEDDVSTTGLLQRINRIRPIVKGKDLSILDLLRRISRIRQRVEGKDLSIPDLLQRIHRAREQVGGSDLPRTNELGFIDFLLENLAEMISSKACYGFQSRFQMIHDELSSLRYSLGKIVEVRNEHKEFEALWNAGVKVAYRVEYLIDQLVFGDFQGSCSTSFDSTVEDILKEVQSINSKIYRASDIQVKRVNMAPNLVLPQNRAPEADEIVGFHDDITSIIDRLTRGSKQLKMVAIVGMPGIGKTTLATKVMDHPSVTFYFHVCLWCCVSQLFNKKKLLLDLLDLIVPNTNIAMSEHDLTQKLWRYLKGKRYLIFLDDVWDIEAWDSLKGSFPDDRNDSRILVTSRHRDAVPQAMLDEEPHFLRQLTNDESWELLRKKLFPRNDWPPALYELGKQIAANCIGLPLTIVIVAGLLANMEPEGWKQFLKNISSISGTDHCMNTLDLSYKHLPGHLKQCFLYFGLFPEDLLVPVNRLIQLWIAEGFVSKTGLKSLEDVGRDYLKDLVGRSLVIVYKERSRGGVKSCRIHGLLHDFCRIKAKEENFSERLTGYDEVFNFEESGYMRRLCVHSEIKHFKNLRLFCPRLHSLLFFRHDMKMEGQGHDISFIVPRYNRLRVLEIRQYWLGSGIPSEIELFLQLKYLAVSCVFSHIPSSIGNLSNLETFIFRSQGFVQLPNTFWNLRKLRHLLIPGGFVFPIGNLENSPDLYELQSCSGAIIHSQNSIEIAKRKFPNIRRLSCWRLVYDSNEILLLKFPSGLESLRVYSLELGVLEMGSMYRLEFDIPENLRKLSLNCTWSGSPHPIDMSVIGKLPNLEVLKFIGSSSDERVGFHEFAWDMEEGEFSKLKFLKLDRMNIVRWTASDDQFPYLQKLVLRHNYLDEVPCCFENINTLVMIDLSFCSDSVNSFFKRIQHEQMEMGNSILKLHIFN